MPWLDVLLKYWSRLSAEMQGKVRQYYLLCTIAEQHGGPFMPTHVRQLEQELQIHRRCLADDVRKWQFIQVKIVSTC